MSWHVGAQLYVWMQYCDARKLNFEEKLEEIFSAHARAGYEGVEGFLGLVDSLAKCERLRMLSRKHGVAMPSFYANSALHTREQAAASIAAILRHAPAARSLGARFINTNPEPISWRGGREKTNQELHIQAEALNELGRKLNEEGLQLLIHGHAPEFKNDAREMRFNLDHTDPARVGLCMDTHWALRGGADLFALTRQYASRMRTLHLRNSRGGIWSEELGDGDIDYRRYAALLREVGFRDGWLFVELATEKGTPQTRPLAESLRISCDYVRETLGVGRRGFPPRASAGREDQ